MVKQVLIFINTNYKFNLFLIGYLIISISGMVFTPLFDEDEGFFAEASRHMVATNDFITVTVNGELRYDKPALFFWFTALSLKIFGYNEFAARLPSFLFFLINLIVLFRFVQKHLTISTAKLAVIIAISITQFQVLSRAAVSDNLLNLCVSVALFTAFEFTLSQMKKDLFWLYTFAGLGFLTKGPIAFLVIFGVIFIYIILSKKYFLFKKFIQPLYIIWSLLIPLPWFYLAYRASGDFLFSDFLIKHNLGRFTQTMESHGGHIWYYLPIIFLSFIPFSHLILKTYSIDKKNNLNLFLIIWFLFPLLFFTFSKTQLPHYISIGYIPLIILISQQKIVSEKGIFIQIIVLISILLITTLTARYVHINDVFVKEMVRNIPEIFDDNYYIFMAALIGFLILIYKFQEEKLLLLSLIFILATNFFLYKFGLLQQAFVKEMGLKLRKTKAEIFMVDHYNPSLSFYSQKVIFIKKEEKIGGIYFKKVSKNKKYIHKILVQKDGYILYEKVKKK